MYLNLGVAPFIDMHGNVWEWSADHWHKSYERALADGSVWAENGDERYASYAAGLAQLYRGIVGLANPLPSPNSVHLNSPWNLFAMP